MRVILLFLLLAMTGLLLANEFEDRLREILNQGENDARAGYTIFSVNGAFSNKEEVVEFLAEACVMISAVRSEITSKETVIGYKQRLEKIDYLCASWFDLSRHNSYQKKLSRALERGERTDGIKDDSTTYMVIKVNDIHNQINPKWGEYGEEPIQRAYELALVQVAILAKNLTFDEMNQGKF